MGCLFVNCTRVFIIITPLPQFLMIFQCLHSTHSIPIFMYFFFLQSRGVYDDLGDDRLTFGATGTVNDVVVSGVAPVTTQVNKHF